MDYYAYKRSVKNFTEFLGKLGLECCIRHRMTAGGWSGPPTPYIKYGVVPYEISLFLFRYGERRKNSPQDDVWKSTY